MNFADIAQYGVAIVSLVVVVYVVREFVGVIKNHLTHSAEAQDSLSQAIHSMLDFLRDRK